MLHSKKKERSNPNTSAKIKDHHKDESQLSRIQVKSEHNNLELWRRQRWQRSPASRPRPTAAAHGKLRPVAHPNSGGACPTRGWSRRWRRTASAAQSRATAAVPDHVVQRERGRYRGGGQRRRLVKGWGGGRAGEGGGGRDGSQGRRENKFGD
jgi:hypothetical protein